MPADDRIVVFCEDGCSAPIYVKNAVAALSYSIDWNAALDRNEGAAITASYWVVPCGVDDLPENTVLPLNDIVKPNFGADPSPKYFLGGTDLNNGVASVILSGGSEDTAYLIQNVVTTNQVPPRVYAQQIQIRVE